MELEYFIVRIECHNDNESPTGAAWVVDIYDLPEDCSPWLDEPRQEQAGVAATADQALIEAVTGLVREPAWLS